MPSVVSIQSGRKPTLKATYNPQPVDLPTLPLRAAIVDEWLSESPVNAIAARYRIDGATVQAIIRAWCEIWHRQAVSSRMEAPSWLRVRHREIEAEVWAETANRRTAA